MNRLVALAICCLLAASTTARAQVVSFDLLGQAGPGLLPGNEVPVVVASSSGGEIGTGITYNITTNILTINIGWGTANGFTNLTGNATLGHIHGPTGAPAPASFTQASGNIPYTLHTLGGWNASASAGGLVDTVTINQPDEAQLLLGHFYINVHTGANPGGEIRGQLVVVPEPSSFVLAGLVGAGYLARRRLKKARS